MTLAREIFTLGFRFTAQQTRTTDLLLPSLRTAKERQEGKDDESSL